MYSTCIIPLSYNAFQGHNEQYKIEKMIQNWEMKLNKPKKKLPKNSEKEMEIMKENRWSHWRCWCGNEKNETNQRGDSQQREEPQLIHAAITLTRKNPGNEKKMKNRLISHSAFSLLCLAI